MTDTMTRLQGARTQLADIIAILEGLTDDDVYARDWQPEHGRSSRGGPRANWTGPDTLQAAYIDAMAELSRAHWELAKTDIPVHWMRRPPVGPRATTLQVMETYRWAVLLDGMLGWLADHHEGDDGPVVAALGHIDSAAEHAKTLGDYYHEDQCRIAGCYKRRERNRGKPLQLCRTCRRKMAA